MDSARASAKVCHRGSYKVASGGENTSLESRKAVSAVHRAPDEFEPVHPPHLLVHRGPDPEWSFT